MIKIFEKIFITLNFTYMCLQMYNNIHHLLTIYIIIEKKKRIVQNVDLDKIF